MEYSLAKYKIPLCQNEKNLSIKMENPLSKNGKSAR
jgi:hypothetical protein